MLGRNSSIKLKRERKSQYPCRPDVVMIKIKTREENQGRLHWGKMMEKRSLWRCLMRRRTKQCHSKQRKSFKKKINKCLKSRNLKAEKVIVLINQV